MAFHGSRSVTATVPDGGSSFEARFCTGLAFASLVLDGLQKCARSLSFSYCILVNCANTIMACCRVLEGLRNSCPSRRNLKSIASGSQGRKVYMVWHSIRSTGAAHRFRRFTKFEKAWGSIREIANRLQNPYTRYLNSMVFCLSHRSVLFSLSRSYSAIMLDITNHPQILSQPDPSPLGTP